jgi:hypothetical protein
LHLHTCVYFVSIFILQPLSPSPLHSHWCQLLPYPRTLSAVPFSNFVEEKNIKDETSVNIDLPYVPAIPLLGIYPKEYDSCYSKGTCTPLFIAALFTIAKLWKHPRCPTSDEWIKKMCYLYTMEFYSATKKNEILTFTSKWMELENIILSKGSQAQKAKNHMFSLICKL